MDEFNRRTFLRSAAATAAGAVLLPAIGQRAAWAGNVARLGASAKALSAFTKLANDVLFTG